MMIMINRLLRNWHLRANLYVDDTSIFRNPTWEYYYSMLDLAVRDFCVGHKIDTVVPFIELIGYTWTTLKTSIHYVTMVIRLHFLMQNNRGY